MNDISFAVDLIPKFFFGDACSLRFRPDYAFGIRSNGNGQQKQCIQDKRPNGAPVPVSDSPQPKQEPQLE